MSLYSIRYRRFLHMNSEAMATGTEIVTDLFGWWEELM